MKSMFVLLSVLVFLYNVSFCDTIEKRHVLAKELVEQMGLKQFYSELFEHSKTQMIDAMTEAIENTPELKDKKFKKFMNEVMDSAKDEYKNLINSEKFTTEYIKLYEDFYSAEELQSMLDFYKTPSGKEIIKKQARFEISKNEMLMTMLKEVQDTIKRKTFMTILKHLKENNR